jgi:F-type H+-transporting ATPase subunit gamma
MAVSTGGGFVTTIDPYLYEAAAYAKPGVPPEEISGVIHGEIGRIILLYNHYKSNASQPPVRETYLPLTLPETADGPVEEDLIVEPGKKQVLESLLPKVLLLKIYTVLMDSYAAEQAARTVAMQLASDNADELLEQLTLEYNKRRQQAITSELLDIVGGSLA